MQCMYESPPPHPDASPLPPSLADPLLDSDAISPLGVYPAPWIGPGAVVHVSLVEAIRVTGSGTKRSKCWFRVGVTDSAWASPAQMAVSPLSRAPSMQPTGQELGQGQGQGQGVESFSLPRGASSLEAAPGPPAPAQTSGTEAGAGAEAKRREDSDSESDSQSASGTGTEAGLQQGQGQGQGQEQPPEEEFDDLLVLQYLDNYAAKFILGLGDDWVDAHVIDSRNAYMLEHLQRALQPLAARVLLSSSRGEEAFDQLCFVDAAVMARYAMGATLTLHSHCPVGSLPAPDSGGGGGLGGAEGGLELGLDSALGAPSAPPSGSLGGRPAASGRQDVQLYFDQTFFQTTARLPLGGAYRGESVTCLVRVEALNAQPSYVSYMCRRLGIDEDLLAAGAGGGAGGEAAGGDEPVVAALKFLIIPIIRKENIHPKVSIHLGCCAMLLCCYAAVLLCYAAVLADRPMLCFASNVMSIYQ
jgi:hypothetical protein